MIKLELKRTTKDKDWTMGQLFVNGTFFCNTLEDCDRGLKQDMNLAEIQKKKIAGYTAIPTGEYRVTLNIQSPKFKLKAAYDWCKGFLPRILKVPAFDGILIHAGENASHTAGCVLVGEATSNGHLKNSMEKLKELYKVLKYEQNITLTIK